MNGFRKAYIPLIIANLIPLVGVLSARWSVLGYLFSYWIETYIISLAVIFKYFLLPSIEERVGSLIRAITPVLLIVIAVSAVLLAILALLLKSISWRFAPAGQLPLLKLFQLFLDYITGYNFILFALTPILINTGVYLGRYILGGDYRKGNLESDAVSEFSFRVILQGFIILWTALAGFEEDVEVMVIIFFAGRLGVEVTLREEKSGTLNGESAKGISGRAKVRRVGLRGKRRGRK
jgi:hypothetical protein